MARCQFRAHRHQIDRRPPAEILLIVRFRRRGHAAILPTSDPGQHVARRSGKASTPICGFMARPDVYATFEFIGCRQPNAMSTSTDEIRLRPILFWLALYGRCRQVLDLDPLLGSTGTIRLAEPL